MGFNLSEDMITDMVSEIETWLRDREGRVTLVHIFAHDDELIVRIKKES